MSDSMGGQAVRYVLVGSIVYAVDLGTFMVLVAVAPPKIYVFANIAAKIAAAALGFVLHKTVTYRWPHRDSILLQSLLYSALLIFNITLSATLFYLAVSVFAQPAIISKIFVDVIVISISFVSGRCVVFRRAPSQIRASGHEQS